MPKYMVAVTEIVEYLVPVTAPDEEQAAEIGERKIEQTRNRDKWCVGVQAREVDGVEIVSKPRVSTAGRG